VSQPSAARCVDPAFWPPGDGDMLGRRNADGQRPQVTELSGYALETLREGSEYILYRGRRSDDADPILVLTPLHAQETPANLR
jgi:hypothetical protein